MVYEHFSLLFFKRKEDTEWQKKKKLFSNFYHLFVTVYFHYRFLQCSMCELFWAHHFDIVVTLCVCDRAFHSMLKNVHIIETLSDIWFFCCSPCIVREPRISSIECFCLLAFKFVLINERVMMWDLICFNWTIDYVVVTAIYLYCGVLSTHFTHLLSSSTYRRLCGPYIRYTQSGKLFLNICSILFHPLQITF